MDLKTVHRFQRVAAQRAQTHHQHVVQDVAVQGVQLDGGVLNVEISHSCKLTSLCFKRVKSPD